MTFVLMILTFNLGILLLNNIIVLLLSSNFAILSTYTCISFFPQGYILVICPLQAEVDHSVGPFDSTNSSSSHIVPFYDVEQGNLDHFLLSHRDSPSFEVNINNMVSEFSSVCP